MKQIVETVENVVENFFEKTLDISVNICYNILVRKTMMNMEKELFKMKEIKKMNKRERREYYAQFRGSWGTVNPVTRQTVNKKRERKCKGGIID